MTNTKGIRIYREDTVDRDYNFLNSYSEKDVSSLAIVAPFRITARVRMFASVPSSTAIWFWMYIVYGGASDDNYQLMTLRAGNNNQIDDFGVFKNTTDRNANLSSGSPVIGLDQQNITDITGEDWVWFEIEVDADRDMTGKIKDDNTTTRPTTWDVTESELGVNATPTQIIQTVGVQVSTASNANVVSRGILEVDEIYVTQD